MFERRIRNGLRCCSQDLRVLRANGSVRRLRGSRATFFTPCGLATESQSFFAASLLHFRFMLRCQSSLSPEVAPQESFESMSLNDPPCPHQDETRRSSLCRVHGRLNSPEYWTRMLEYALASSLTQKDFSRPVVGPFHKPRHLSLTPFRFSATVHPATPKACRQKRLRFRKAIPA